MPNLSYDDLETILMGAYAEGWNNRDAVPEHEIFKVDAWSFWLKSRTRKDFQNRLSSVTRQSGPTPEQIKEIKEAANEARERVSKMSLDEKAELEAAARKRISEGRSKKAKAG